MTNDNRLLRDLHDQTAEDASATMIVVARADVEEVIAVVREAINTPHSHESCWEGYYETCVFCGAAVEVEECAVDCLRKRAAALLARMGVTDE
jgi:hypothetical protein